MPRLTFTVAEAAEALGITERHYRRLIERGEVPHLRLGGRVVVPKVALTALLAGDQPATATEQAS